MKSSNLVTSSNQVLGWQLVPVQKMDVLYMDIAKRVAQESCATKRQVGSVIVKDTNIISYGWNGMPAGEPNSDIEYLNADGVLKTSPLAIHAESNAIGKLARQTQSSSGGTIFQTLSPCIGCAKLILQAELVRVVFATWWDDQEAIDAVALLLRRNVIVTMHETRDTMPRGTRCTSYSL